MSSDLKRIKTFLSYKGFKWEPLLSQARRDDGSTDYIASMKGVACFHGTTLSIGKERPYDGCPIQAVTDEEEKSGLRVSMARRLVQSARRLEMAAGSELPKVVAMVNHDPRWRFEDLFAMLEALPTKEPPPIDLVIWFDDYRSDNMLFRKSDPIAYQRLFNWFHVA